MKNKESNINYFDTTDLSDIPSDVLDKIIIKNEGLTQKFLDTIELFYEAGGELTIEEFLIGDYRKNKRLSNKKTKNMYFIKLVKKEFLEKNKETQKFKLTEKAIDIINKAVK